METKGVNDFTVHNSVNLNQSVSMVVTNGNNLTKVLFPVFMGSSELNVSNSGWVLS